MFLEYLFQPVQNARYAVLAIQRIEPRLPFWFLAAITVLFITAWLAVGLIYAAYKTRFFTLRQKLIDFSES